MRLIFNLLTHDSKDEAKMSNNKNLKILPECLYTGIEGEVLKNQTLISENLEPLIDEKYGKVIDWKGHKERSMEVAGIYQRIGVNLGAVAEQEYFFRKAERLGKCAHTLVYKFFPETLEKTLYQAFFCKVRLCPMCGWRRSLKVFGQTSKVMDYITENRNYRYLFLTLTAKNVTGTELSEELDRYFKAYNLLTKRKEFKALSKGWFRCLEITHNWGMGTYHPHFHVIIAVNKSYFTEKKVYLSQKKWAKMWQDCLSVDYEPIVDVRTIKPDEKLDTDEPFSVTYKNAVAEVAKYTAKHSDYVLRPDPDASKYGRELYEQLVLECERRTDEAVIVLDKAIKNRRLCAFGGEMKDIHKKLSLDDAIDGDLIKVADEIRPDLQYALIHYRWRMGLWNFDYYKTKR